jgi:hypothetical protein
MDNNELKETGSKSTIVPCKDNKAGLAPAPDFNSSASVNNPFIDIPGVTLGPVIIKRKKRTEAAQSPESPQPVEPQGKREVKAKGSASIDESTIPDEENIPAKKRVVQFDPDRKILKGVKKLAVEAEGQPSKKKGKYQHKHPTEPPKRVRKILTRSNEEVLKKLAELLELEKIHDPEAAKLREEKEAKRIKALQEAPLVPKRINKKAQRYLKKYGIAPPSPYEGTSTKKVLNYKLLFNYSPIEEMSDEDAMANMRLLFLAHSDHKLPKTMEKFIKYMKNNMCFGITDEQLDRVMGLLIEYKYLIVLNDKVTLNIK